MGPIYNSYLYSSREELCKIVHPLAHPPAFPSSFLKKVGVAACDVAACTPTLPGHPRVLRATLSHRALFPMEWQAVLELVSIFDDPARTNKQIKRGRHEFVGRTINDFTILHAALEDPVQEIRCLQIWDGLKKEVSASTLQPHVRLVLTE